MTSDVPHPAVTRVSRHAGINDLAEVLSSLPGSDFASLMLAVSSSRADARSAADVVAQHARDRFVGPAPVDFHRLRRVEDRAIARVREPFEFVTLAPLVPLGTHAALARVNQNNLVSTFEERRLPPTQRPPWPSRPLRVAVNTTQGASDSRPCSE